MTTIVSATRERFLLAIAGQVPPERIAEIHLFPGIKQGGIESGVAVVAATRVGPDGVSAVVPSSADDADRPERFTVFTANYRLVLKGPDRGKWEASVVEEADAPLLTVESVVRGVQRRSGDVEDPERMTGDDVRSVVQAVAARAG